MPATSPDAMERKREARNAARRAKRKAKRNTSSVGHVEHWNWMLPSHKITARRMMSCLPKNITKSELREMLATACKNTEAM